MGEKLEEAEIRRRRREYVIIALSIIAVVAVTAIEVRLSRLSEELPISNNILFFALFNIDLVLVLLLVFLVVRNITKLFVERRRGIFGSRLKTRLVSTFVALSLLPTGILFFVALKFMNFSLEGWFDPQVSKVFETGNEIVQSKYEDDGEEMLHFAQQMRNYIQDMDLLRPDRNTGLKDFLEYKRLEYGLTDVRLVWGEGKLPMTVTRAGVTVSDLTLTPSGDFIDRALDGQEGYMIAPAEEMDIVRGVVPIHHGGPAGPIEAALVAQTIIDKSLFQQMKANERGYQSYIELRRLKNPIKTMHIIFLVITSLLVLFSASWFGFHIAKTLTVPLVRLAGATEQVAEGDLDVTTDAEGQDEMSVLARSFNRMTHQLKAGTNELERAYGALERKNIELDQRRRYIEIVLANVAAGVISSDANGIITTINENAENMFKINVPEVLGKTFDEVLRPEHKKLFDDLLEELRSRKDGSVRRVIVLNVGGSPVHFQVTLTELRSEDGELIGLVGVFEDMTQILQAQKAVAWREVARRIAHEIKNPLTPIQLYAERLRKLYSGKIGGKDEEIFVECIDLISDQVRELRDLVNEFRKFARMPSARPAPADLNEAIREATLLFQESASQVTFSMSLDSAMPIFDIDREQIKRMMNNLLDNAVAAIDGSGQVSLTTTFIEALQIARIEVSDTGRGIPLKDRARVFEPDFSTTKGGSGLGLAIVQRIVSEHFGYIRVRDNQPRGATFVIELPTHLPRLGVAAPAHRNGSADQKRDTESMAWET